MIPHLPEEYQLDFLKKIAGGNPEILVRLLTPFLSAATSNREMLQEALEQEDKDLASQAAHQLAPKIRSIGIEALATSFVSIDKQPDLLLQNGEWHSLIQESLLQLDAVIEAVRQDLAQVSGE